MSADTKKKYGSALALVALSVLALYAGIHWLPLLILAAAVVWFIAAPRLRRGRN